MEQAVLFKRLRDPELYDSKGDVEVMQTHISFLVLVDDVVYKVKKEVDFGFLDYSTLEKRKRWCEEEMRLNSRLAPDLYLGVVSITQSGDSIEFDGKGEVIEYAVKMKRFSQDHLMSRLLGEDTVSREHIDSIVELLSMFYKEDNPSEEVIAMGGLEIVRENVMENFEQTESKKGITISEEQFELIHSVSVAFMDEQRNLFEKRQMDGYIHACHGDLHTGNIVINPSGKVTIFDGIEFNKRFRMSDIAADIGFLAMDLDRKNKPFLSSYLMKRFIESSGDSDITKILNFYKCYRAYVRGKVLGFRVDDPHISDRDKRNAIEDAKKYYRLASYYAGLCKIQLHARKKPFVLMVGGLSGTGKSTLAEKLSVDYDAVVLDSDVIRKQLAGIDVLEKHHDEFDCGLYSEERTKKTYEELIRQTRLLIDDGRNVVVDATFRKEEYRKNIKECVEETGAGFVALWCTASDEQVKIWLDQRVKSMTASDGRWEIYVHQKKTMDPLDGSIQKIDMSIDKYEKQLELFETIYELIMEAM